MQSCADYIAQRIKRTLQFNDIQELLIAIGKVKSDLTPEGDLASNDKRLDVTDINGKTYRINIIEL